MIRKEYTAYSYGEAIKMIEDDGYAVKKDKTIAWKKMGCRLRDRDLKSFGVEHLARERLRLPGEGFIIVIRPGRKDTRTRPFKYLNIKRGKGMIAEKCFMWRRDDTGEVIETLTGVSKKEAVEIGKDIASELKVNLTLEVTYQVKNSICGHLKYKPSINAKLGLYLFIGIETDVFK